MRASFRYLALACSLGASVLFAVQEGGPVVHAARPDKQGLGAAVAPIRLVPTGVMTTSVQGLHSYFGTVELNAASDGIVISNRLPLEYYLLGLNEVPPEWPAEALRAQAVAARTYALFTMERPRAGTAATYGFDICASVQCQVFSGADVVRTSDGARWVQAVRDTTAEAVLYHGNPILARYHSTSGGRTLDNQEAFPEERAYPYLRSVTSTTEETAPLHRWRAEFSLGDLQTIIERAGWWPADKGQLLQVRTIASRTGLHYPDVLLKGKHGRVVRTAEELRTIVRDLAPALDPALYPSFAFTSSGRLPETFPSNRIRITTHKDVVLVNGRGWGHGVGMSQWGAYGLAEQGFGYEDILSHYYTGTTVGVVDEASPIEVGLAWGEPKATATGSFRIIDGRGRTLVERAIGTWTFDWRSTGVISIEPPEGYRLPLEVGIVHAPSRAETGEPVPLKIALSRPAEVRTVTETGATSAGSRTAVKDAGSRLITWRAPGEPGKYEVRVAASSGDLVRRSEEVQIVVSEGETIETPSSEVEGSERAAPEGGGASPVPLIVVGLVLAMGLIVAIRAVTMKG